MSEYHMDEALFDLPAGWTDQSVHALTRTIAGTTERLAVTVMREDLTAGRSLAEHVDHSLALQRRSLQGFELLDRTDDVDVAGLAGVAASVRWRSATGPVYHRHVFALVHGRVMSFVGTCRFKHRDAADDEVDAMVATLRIREART